MLRNDLIEKVNPDQVSDWVSSAFFVEKPSKSKKENEKVKL